MQRFRLFRKLDGPAWVLVSTGLLSLAVLALVSGLGWSARTLAGTVFATALDLLGLVLIFVQAAVGAAYCFARSRS